MRRPTKPGRARSGKARLNQEPASRRLSSASEAAHRVLGALREDLGDVGGALQGVVVEGDQHAVAAALHVGFQVVGAEVAGQQVGRGGFLGASYEAPRWAMTAGQGTPAAALGALPDGSAAWAASPAVRPRRPRVLNVPCQNLCRMRRLSFFLFHGIADQSGVAG